MQEIYRLIYEGNVCILYVYIYKTTLRDRVRVYRQHIRQSEYQKCKAEEHFRTCGKGTFKIFPLLQMRSSEIDLRRSYERNFMKKCKTKLNNL